jgi:CDP-glucose 4,6-dehydratase
MENLELMLNPNPSFWSGQRVLLIGHTGFSGSWLTIWLEQLGAEIFGLALPPHTQPNLFELLHPFSSLQSRYGDIRNLDTVRSAVQEARPTVAIHLAAQPLVRRSYREPVETFATNVMGTVHVLEALRDSPQTKAVLVVTTDKVYANKDDGRVFVEDDRLGGGDPYSASKAGAELAVQSWVASFFQGRGTKIGTVRAGNIIGGGDWSEDRVVPDVWRAVRQDRPVLLRHPSATRPWQHVLDAMCGYLLFTEQLASGSKDTPAALNIGPLPSEALRVSEVVDILLSAFKSTRGWDRDTAPELEEMKTLALDPGLAMRRLGWALRLPAREASAWTAEWYRLVEQGRNPRQCTLDQLERYLRLDGGSYRSL